MSAFFLCALLLVKNGVSIGYYVATIGNLTEEAIKKYIAEQSEESRKEDSEGSTF